MIVSRRRAWLCLVLLPWAVGCGKDLYEQRFEETKKYFAHLDRLNQALSPTWHGLSVDMRIPRSFQLIAGPGKRPAEGDETERDPRQPPIANVDLPGLQGAWQSDVSPGGGKDAAKAYLYVLSNYELLGRKGGEEKATAFNDNVVRTIATAVSQPVPDLGKLPSAEFPQGEAYVEKRKFRILKPGLPATIDEKEYRVQIYAFWQELAVGGGGAKSSAQVSLVLLLPVDAPTEKITRALELALQTLTVTKDRPVAASAGTKGPAANPRSL